MKHTLPIIVGCLGLGLSLWMLISSTSVIYQAWTRHGNSVSAWYYIEVVASLLGIALLAFLAFKGRSLPLARTWWILLAVLGGQMLIAALHLASFFGAFRGTPFN